MENFEENGFDLALVKEEESKLKHENDEYLAKEETEHMMNDVSISSEEKTADEIQKEMRERRCQRLMNLLKRSRTYAGELINQIITEGMKNMRKKKTKGWRKKSISKDEINNQDYHLEETSDVQDLCDFTDEGDKDFFAQMRTTSLGFTVSSYQPLLLEGGTMRDYQLKGLMWMTKLFANGVNGILADEMGLGKTIQAISLICSLIESGMKGPFLIIAPLSTLGNWIAEFRKFAPKVPTLFFHGNKKERTSLIGKIHIPTNVLKWKVAKVVVTSYEVILFEKGPLSKVMWHYIVVDEGHRIKNYNAQISRALREFNSVGKLLITGTPLQNDLAELWSLLNFIIPEVFNSLEVFELWFDIKELESGGTQFMQEKYNVNVISTLQQILIPFLLRREKKDVCLDLPPKKEVLVYCPITPLQKRLYEATVDRSIERLLNPKRPNEDPIGLSEPLPKRRCVMIRKLKSLELSDSNAEALESYRKQYCQSGSGIYGNDFAVNISMRNPQMQLRKIINHPYLIQFPLNPGTGQLEIDENLVKNSGKLLVVDAMLSKLKARGHKVIIFSTFKLVLDMLEYFADMRDYTFRRLDGNSSLKDREVDIAEFNENPDVFLFFASMRAGGLGINLTGADTIIIYDSDWNPQINLQSQDRCHRIGQTKPVVIYRLCVRSTIDEQIILRGNAKRRLEKIIIQEGKFKAGVENLKNDGQITVEDLKNLKESISSSDHDSVIHSNGFVFTDEELDALLDRSEMSKEKESNPEKNKIFKSFKVEPESLG